MQVHVVVTAYGLQIGEVRDHRGLLAAEGQVDKVCHIPKIQLFRHGLKLRGLTNIKAVQPLCQVVQLVQIDGEHLHSL